MERVLGSFEKSDRPPQVPKCRLAMALHCGKACKRPVEANARIRIEDRIGARREVTKNLASLLKPAEVRERVAKVGRKADASSCIFLRLSRKPIQTALIKGRGLLRLVEGEIR